MRKLSLRPSVGFVPVLPTLLASLVLSTTALAIPGKAAATVTSCSSVSFTNLAFGNYNPIGPAPVSTFGTITLTCTANAAGAQAVSVNIIAASSSVCGAKFMSSASNRLVYVVYADAAHTNEFCQTNPYTINFVAANSPKTSSFTFYGNIGSGQNIPPGSYSDSITATTAASTSNVTTSFQVLATVPANCTVSATPIAFPSTSLIVSNVDATASISTTCTKSTVYTVGLSNGGTGTGPTARKMTKGSDSITYGLYLDAARSQPWSMAAGNMGSGTGTGVAQALTVYGRVPSGQTPPPGTYNDTVIVTVSY